MQAQPELTRGQLTIRGVSPELLKSLKLSAKRHGCSVNQTVLNLLQTASGLTPQAPSYHDLDDLFGSWTDAEGAEFDAHLSQMRQIDLDLWR